MTFALLPEERELLTKAESEFMSWQRSEAHFAKVLVPGFPVPKRGRGRPPVNHLGHVWVRIAAQHWLDPNRDTSPRRPAHWPAPAVKATFHGREPGAKNSRFLEALTDFSAGKGHLPTFSEQILEEEIKNWRQVRMPPRDDDDSSD